MAASEGSRFVERDSVSSEIVRLDADSSGGVIVAKMQCNPPFPLTADGWLIYAQRKAELLYGLLHWKVLQTEVQVTDPTLDVYDFSAGPDGMFCSPRQTRMDRWNYFSERVQRTYSSTRNPQR